MKFEPKSLDFNLSPYTGYTRNTWIEAAHFIMEGVFSNIKDFQDPVIVKRKETEISYPHLNDPEDQQHAQRLAEMFEGLTRSFFFAAPLIKENPELAINGINLRDYYKNQVYRSCNIEDEYCVGTYEMLQDITNHADPFRPFQQTVETCALVICLWICKEQIWDTYTKAEKDVIAKFLSSFGHANTVPQNWRCFNMLDLAFLYNEGYEIDKDIMHDHAQAILAYSVGDGWYRDGQCFDYYSCWAFNVYAPLWCQWYGYKNEPGIAKQFEINSNKLMETYPDFFDIDGYTNMWGRSNIYRNAATSAFDGNFFLDNPTVNPGVARRVSSGSLKQFFEREDVFFEGVPVLGFYGQFGPLVQGYSCAESPYWMGKAFLCLHLSEDHPFWSAKEELGTWEKLKRGEVKETTLNGPGLCFTNHEANGETNLRTGKIVKTRKDMHGMWNYSKLCFNTKYPWEATPNGNDKIKKGEVESQQYVLKDIISGDVLEANATFWGGQKDGVLYRRQFFDYHLETEMHWIHAINLADFPVANGIIRVDKNRRHRSPLEYTLGSFGFPDNGTEVAYREKNGAKAIILKGKDSLGNNKQLAMTIFYGWDEISYLSSEKSNPDSEKSIVVFAKSRYDKQYDGAAPYLMISQTITKESAEDFTDDELFSIDKIEFSDETKNGSYGDTKIYLKDGSVKVVNFDEIESALSL